jgi:hypothetical protein
MVYATAQTRRILSHSLIASLCLRPAGQAKRRRELSGTPRAGGRTGKTGSEFGARSLTVDPSSKSGASARKVRLNIVLPGDIAMNTKGICLLATSLAMTGVFPA